MASTHRCPQCGTVGKVHRSRPRGFFEDLRRFIFPVFSVYRCHNCNWRGWLLRSGAKSTTGRLVLAAYVVVLLALIVALVLLVREYWPNAEFQY
jgi:hypothetical protein